MARRRGAMRPATDSGALEFANKQRT